MNHYNISLSFKIIQNFLLYGIALLCCVLAGCGEKKTEQAREQKKKVKSGLSIIREDDCLNCHSIKDKSVGPPYVQIAKRYEADFGTINRLADKIIEGGGGIWGGAQMTKHPLIKKEDAKKIVRWILSLDDTIAYPNPMVHTPGVKLVRAFQSAEKTRADKNGLTIRAYDLEELQEASASDFPEISPQDTPSYVGYVETIHFPGPSSFEPLQDNFALQVSGFIHINKKGKYFFKQVRSGKGRVFLNGDKIINEQDWDSEIAIDLLPGTYPISVEYLVAKGEKSLSLQWIAPDDEYYQVIPEDVFTENSIQTSLSPGSSQRNKSDQKLVPRQPLSLHQSR